MAPQDDKKIILVEALNDLACIHNDRIAGYQAALNQLSVGDSDIHDEFANLILDGNCFRQQLLQQVSELIGSAKEYPVIPIFGSIYLAWIDLRTAVSGHNLKSLISSCKYNEELTINLYRAVLQLNIPGAGETLQLLETHERGLKKESEKIRKYHNPVYTVDYRTMYYTS